MLRARLETINPNEVLLYLGYNGGEVPDGLEAQIAACAEEIKKAARPKVTYRIFAVPEESAAGQNGGRGVFLQGVPFPLEGNDIARHLRDCTLAVLMAATLGPDAETLLMRAQVQDMSRALILDSCASTAIENVCDLFETDLRAEYETQGLYLTDRFSPGYGDMPIGQQRDFCELLDTRRRIGLSVSQSGILLPRKSVTAVMGVSDTPRTRRSSGCANCSMFRTCQIRRDGRFCGADTGICKGDRR